MSKYFTDEQVQHWFAYHPPGSEDVVRMHEDVRDMFSDLAVRLNHLLPEGPDKSATFRALREAMWNANATIACNQE